MMSIFFHICENVLRKNVNNCVFLLMKYGTISSSVRILEKFHTTLQRALMMFTKNSIFNRECHIYILYHVISSPTSLQQLRNKTRKMKNNRQSFIITKCDTTFPNDRHYYSNKNE